MKKILHITTHLGGGVGKVISDLCLYENNTTSDIHEIILLEEAENQFFINKLKNSNINVSVCNDINLLSNKMKNSDVVIIHWWHHPLMAEFLANFPKEEIRLVIWVHISGCTYPIAPQLFLEKAHHVLFATPYSYENTFWESKEKILEKSSVVYGLGELKTKNIIHSINDDLTIGYVGTLNYSKLHPNYLSFCKAVINEFPKVKFVLVGNVNKALQEEIIKCGLENNFEFTGYVDNVYSQLSRFDIFAYLLNPYHFGATENALLEAMAYELPVIALNQSVEKHIIQHMETGILINNESEFVNSIKLILKDNKLKEKITKKAGNYIKQEFSFENNVMKFNSILENISKQDKKAFAFNDILGNTPHEWFLSGVGKEKNQFINFINNNNEIENLEPIFRENSKSSIKHFCKYFKNDEILNKLYDKIK